VKSTYIRPKILFDSCEVFGFYSPIFVLVPPLIDSKGYEYADNDNDKFGTGTPPIDGDPPHSILRLSASIVSNYQICSFERAAA
jgi:hypothetical protein